ITHSQLHHPNILPFHGVYHEEANSPPLTIVPYIDGGSLQGLLTPKTDNMTYYDTLTPINQLFGIGEGVCYLHSLHPPVIHGDLHPGNVLLDKGGKAYLCDFGLSRVRHEVSRTRTQRVDGGFMRFLAPELTNSPNDKFRTSWSSDVYSLAMLLFNIWTGERPFSNIELEWRVAVASTSGKRPQLPTGRKVHIPQPAEKQFWKLVREMWVEDPDKRPKSHDVLERLMRMPLQERVNPTLQR
ncbi:kinase-like protein, partial [Clavulina sp. PMI_390]